MDYSAQMQQYYHRVIDACHILHHYGAVDADGHISFRHPRQPDVFIMPCNKAPAAVSSEADLVEYRVCNAEPLDPSAPGGHIERRIHSEIYKHFKDVNSIVHSHSAAIIPYTISTVRLRPCSHVAGFLRDRGPPVFDIATYMEPDDQRDLLIRTERLGRKLAFGFSGGDVVVLMRGHGFTVVADSIELAVFRAIYTLKNAATQSEALNLQAAAQTSLSLTYLRNPKQGIHYLSKEEADAAAKTAQEKEAVQRSWELWVREVQASKLYMNCV
ncbi:hypothetical protein VTK56DRAFT_7315 [Thermocarpiscus australiensis]